MKAAEFLNLSPESVRVASESQEDTGRHAQAEGRTITRLVVTLQGGRVQWMMESRIRPRCAHARAVHRKRARRAGQAGLYRPCRDQTQQYDGVLIINFAYSRTTSHSIRISSKPECAWTTARCADWTRRAGL